MNEIDTARERIKELESLLREALNLLQAIADEGGLQREEYALLENIQAALTP